MIIEGAGVRVGRARATAALVALALLASGCSGDDRSAGAEGGTTTLLAAADAEFRTGGSIRQAWVTDAPPGALIRILDDEGTELAEGKVDGLGSHVFRGLEPGEGYVVETVDGDERQRSAPVTVLDEADTPPDSLYEQELVKGLNYVKMRDGIELAVTVRLPPGTTLEDGPFPTVIEYSGYETAAPNDLIDDIGRRLTDPSAPPDPLVPASSTAVGSILAPLIGFATASVQIRGSGCSGGDFQLFGLPTIYDGYDIVETVAAQPWVKGNKVGMVGISYSGYSQLFVGGTRPPSLAALAPMSVLADLYDGIGFPGGIFNNGFAKNWLNGRQEDAKPAPEGGQAWARELVRQGDENCTENQKLRLQTLPVLELLDRNPYRSPALYDDRVPAEWAERIEVPTFLVGSFHDEQVGSHWLTLADRFADNPKVWITAFNGNHNDALMPEVLTRWVEFLQLYVADQVPEIPGAVLGLAGVLYSEMGDGAAPPLEQSRFAGTTDVEAARAAFETHPRLRMLLDVGAGPLGPRSLQSTGELISTSWPPANVTPVRWHLGAEGRLVPDGAAVGTGDDRYRADPAARPATNNEDGGAVYGDDEPYTWAPVADGKGLGYVSAPLEEDLVIAGPASVDLHVASSGDDADVQVTLSEVRPDGQETYIGSGWLRLSHRKLDRGRSSELFPVQTHLEGDAEPLVPDRPVDARIGINPTAHQLRAGSRIRLTILAPGGDVPEWRFRTTEDGSRTVSVVRELGKPSSLVLPVVGGAAVSTPLPACNTLRGQPCRPYVPASNGG